MIVCPPAEGKHRGSIVSGADGNLWFTTGLSINVLGWSTLQLLPNASLPGTIDRITPEGVITYIALRNGDGVASSLAVGPDGIWFTDSVASRVGEIDWRKPPGCRTRRGHLLHDTQGDGSRSYLVKVAPGGG